ncbi:homeobox protein Hox-C12 [Platysternon megacephalum]|uniref:Homeobox protein Hox-C12 n=1 Tax=Platysternon megacephalum TaxID=55544 RepID=A0A4D9DLC3_9SAUR|nr:homeobox protein Hox-C12 [Platysternon megacephalum]
MIVHTARSVQNPSPTGHLLPVCNTPPHMTVTMVVRNTELSVQTQCTHGRSWVGMGGHCSPNIVYVDSGGDNVKVCPPLNSLSHAPHRAGPPPRYPQSPLPESGAGLAVYLASKGGAYSESTGNPREVPI